MLHKLLNNTYEMISLFRILNTQAGGFKLMEVTKINVY